QELEEAGPQATRSSLKVKLLSLYAWSIADPMEMAVSFAVVESDIKKMKTVISNYLYLDRFISYCQAKMESYLDLQELRFEDGILPHEQKLLRLIIPSNRLSSWDHPHFRDFKGSNFPYPNDKHLGLRLFDDCAILMHKYPEKFMPTEDEITKPTLVLKKALDAILMKKYEQQAVFVPKSFVALMNDALPQIDLRQRILIKQRLDFPDQGEYDASLTGLTSSRRDQIFRKGISRLSGKTYPRLLDSSSQKITQLSSAVQNQIDLIKNINDLKKESIDKQVEIEKLRSAGLKIIEWASKIENPQFGSNELIAFMALNSESLSLLNVSKELERDTREKMGLDLSGNIDFYLREMSWHDLSLRTYNCLRAADIDYGWQLAGCSEEQLAKIRNLGKHSLIELKDLSRSNGFSFNTRFSPETFEYLVAKTIGDKSQRFWEWIIKK
ncbi:MAG TPA: DNA-directed RNA polymerase subunit alpha C-terminal domain-containing protein, partial [Candidatus Paceibacterota bacterium]|nr:DNA-directed RNA polymerase subunit alpha C-terminal domain-containing protein [Candidatus Paceibacterota bacterium]